MARVAIWLNVVLTLLVGAAALAAGIGLLGGEWRLADVASHFAPIYGGICLLGAAWSVLAGRGPVIAASVLGLLASGVLIAPEFRRDAGPIAAADAPDQIKVIQFNVSRRNRDLARVTAWIGAQGADVVTITEATDPLRDRMLREGWQVAGRAGDLMIFTREPYVGMTRPKPKLPLDVNFVNATYATGSGPMEVVTAHYVWPTDPIVKYQAGALDFVVANRPRDRMILTGDFNATPWSAELKRMDAKLGLTRRERALATWPAEVLGQRWPLPFLPIDHVYAGPGWATVKVERGPHLGSDHYPLIVTLAPR